ncbi:hypothetical protein [Anthocerotibacter panamensis]|nr:hypothetical protein [Anthocerotibacter panamensis]
MLGIEEAIQELVDDAVQFAEESPEPPVDEIYRFVHAEDEYANGAQAQ